MEDIETYFLITVNNDGTLTSYAQLPESLPEIRQATNYDVYQASKQIVEEYEAQLLANRVANLVASALIPTQTNPSTLVKDKLKERGIDPESIDPVN